MSRPGVTERQRSMRAFTAWLDPNEFRTLDQIGG